MKTFCFLCLTSFLLIVTTLVVNTAQASEGEWRTYTVADGLAGSGVKSIFQDSKGYLWFGTCDGVSRFDGERFENFTQADRLPFNCTTRILEDPRGDIWFLTERSVSRYDGSTLHPITEKDGLAGGYSEVIFLDSKGNLWFANEHGATKYDGVKFQTLGAGVLKGRIQVIFEDSRGHLWFAGTSIFRYDGGTFHLIEANRLMEAPRGKRAFIRLIEEDSVGNLWFAGDAALLKFDGETFESFRDKGDRTEWPNNSTVQLWTGMMSIIHVLPEGSPWYGVQIHIRAGGSTANQQTQPRFFGQTVAIATDSIFKDQRGVLWFNDNGFVAKWDGKAFRPFIMAGNWDEIQNVIPEAAYNEKLGYFEPAWFKYRSPSQPEKELALRKAGLLPGKVVMEDGKGNLWLLGKQGVYLYDGARVKMLLTLEEGLGGGDISAFLKDQEGNLWFGHDRGVTRYNPDMSLHNIHPKAELESDNISALFVDSQQNVWFGVHGGSGIARYDGEKLHSLSAERLGLPGKRQMSIDTFLEDGKGGLWIFGNSYDSLFHSDGKRFRNISLVETDVSSLDYNVSYGGPGFRPTVDAQGNLWGMREFSLVKVHPQPVIVEKLRPRYGEFGGATFDKLTMQATAVIEGSPMARAGLKVGDRLVVEPEIEPAGGSHPSPGVKVTLKVNRNGTELTLRAEFLEVERLRPKYGEFGGVSFDQPTMQVTAVMEGSPMARAGLKVGDGLVGEPKVEPAGTSEPAPGVKVTFKVNRNGAELTLRAEFLEGDFRREKREFQEGDFRREKEEFLKGDFRRGEFLREKVERHIEVIDTSSIPRGFHANDSGALHYGMVSATHADGHGGVWVAIGWSDGGVIRYDGKGARWFNTEDGLIGYPIVGIFEDKTGALWFAGQGGAVSWYDGKAFQNFRVEALRESEPSNRIVSVRQVENPARGDAKGVLWFIFTCRHYGAEAREEERVFGIGRYDGEHFTSLKARDALAEPLKSINIRDALIDGKGHLWLATNQGAIRYDGKQFIAYSRKDGLPVNDLRDILEDSKGRLWFATWGGGVVVTDGETFQNLSTHDGLVADRVSQILEDQRGQLWFGTPEGLSRYTPPAQRFPPFIHIQQVVADDVYTDAKRIRVPASIKRIHIEYRGISFKSRRLRYRYKLEGYDKDWTTTWETECDYVKLPPGDYTFKVVAVNQNLDASELPAQVVLTVLPPFYKRLGFILPTSTGTLLLLLFSFSQRRDIAKLTKRLLRTEEKVQQTQAQLIQAEKMATVGTLAGGVAHEINNPLDAILGSVQRILRFAEDHKIVESAKSAQEGTRRCKEIVEKLLKYSRQSSGEFTLLDVNQVIEDTVTLLGHQLKVENISLQMQLSPGLKVRGNFNELSQVVTNLLTNAKDAIIAARATGVTLPVDGEGRGGVITVRTAAANEVSPSPVLSRQGRGEYNDADLSRQILIEVSDNGIGIKEEHLRKLFDPFFTTKPVGKGTGLGLSICQGIVEKHHGRIEVSSKVGEGATFRVCLPIAESNLEKV